MDNAMNTAGAHALDEVVSALGLKLTSPTARTVASVPAAGNDPVFETGSRNNTLASLAGSMRARGMQLNGGLRFRRQREGCHVRAQAVQIFAQFHRFHRAIFVEPLMNPCHHQHLIGGIR